MWRRTLLILCLIWPAAARAAEVTDATGRRVAVPDQVQRIAAAGPRAAVLSEAIAPNLMPGWPGALSETAKGLLAKGPAWQALRIVRTGHAVVAPHLPFGWIKEPPSSNAWLSGKDPALLAAVANAVLYGRSLTPAERTAVADDTVMIRS